MNRNTNKLLTAIIFVCLFAAFLLLYNRRNRVQEAKYRIITVSVPHDWKTPLYPASQHSMIEDGILTNAFESLVQRGENGLILPLASKSFRFSDNYTRLEFEIDVAKTFSDGSPLSSMDFKRSWETGLKLKENSANKNLYDITKFIVGGDDFDRSGQLVGVETPNSHTLIVQFTKPFRMALTHLTGARFAAFKETDGHFIGTGKYYIDHISNESVSLKVNLHHTDESDFDEIRMVHYSDPIEKLREGDLDIVAYNRTVPPASENISETMSIEDISLWFHINGNPGRFFSNKLMRKAFQALIRKIINENRAMINSIPRQFRIDFQTFLPLQAGRLDPKIVDEIISEGDPYIADLIARSKIAPLNLAISGTMTCLLPLLKDAGLNFVNTEHASTVKLLDELYNKQTFDVLAAGASVHTSDPDGVYHLLGKQGAITSPMIQRERVSKLLEEGRELISQDDISAHYTLVNEAILDEVPGVHIGFASDNYLYRSDRLEAKQEYIERHFDLFWKVFRFKD